MQSESDVRGDFTTNSYVPKYHEMSVSQWLPNGRFEIPNVDKATHSSIVHLSRHCRVHRGKSTAHLSRSKSIVTGDEEEVLKRKEMTVRIEDEGVVDVLSVEKVAAFDNSCETNSLLVRSSYLRISILPFLLLPTIQIPKFIDGKKADSLSENELAADPNISHHLTDVVQPSNDFVFNAILLLCCYNNDTPLDIASKRSSHICYSFS